MPVMIERLKELLHASPFQPFSVVMSDGSRHEIRHPENALLSKHFLIIVDADDDERIHDLYLLHLAHLDRKVASQSKA